MTFDDNRTTNYNAECSYAHPIDLNISFTYNPNPTTPNTLDTILYFLKEEDSGHTLLGSSTDIRKINIVDISKAIFPAGDHNGTSEISIKLNFNRKYNEPINPFEMNITDINVTDDDNISKIVYDSLGTHAPDTNATYYFSRAKSSKYLYDNITTNSIKTPISIVVYSDPIASSSPNFTIFKPTEEYDWYLSSKHTTADGNLTLVAKDTNTKIEGASSKTYSQISNGFFKNSSSDVTISYNSGSSRPHTSDINLTGTNSWLIYNKDLSTEPNPFYKVRFIGTSGWTGEGKTGHIIGNDINTKKTKRLEW